MLSTQYCLSEFEFREGQSCIGCFATRDNVHYCSAWLIHRAFQISCRLLWAVLSYARKHTVKSGLSERHK